MNFISSRLSIDLRSLAAFRIGIGAMLFVDIFRRFSNLSEHYSEVGALPLTLRLSEIETLSVTGQWSVFFLGDSIWFAALLLGLTAFCAILLTIGWQSRIVVIVCWILYASLLVRNPYIRDGGHNMLRLFLWWGMFLPISARWSMDSFRLSNSLLRSPPERTHSFSGGTVGLLVQIAMIYWMAAIWKASGVWRNEENALAQALTIESLITDLSPPLLQFPELLQLGTRLALVIEEVGPLVALAVPVFSSWRSVAVASMILLHVSIASIFALGIFPLIAICGWLAFLPTPFWDNWERRFDRWKNSSITKYKPPALLATEFPSTNRMKLLRSNRWASYFALFCMVYVILWNLSALPVPNVNRLMPEKARHFGRVTQLAQRWSFFAPEILTRDGWFVAAAALDDGRVIDLWRNGAPLTFDKPESIRMTYRDKPWRQYLTHLFHHRRAYLSEGFANWLRREWDEAHPENPILDLNVYFMLQDSKYPEDGIQPILLYPCREIDDKGAGIFKGDLRLNERLRAKKE